MGRAPGGHQVLEQAKAQIAKAKTIEELKQAQAVVLPLEFGLSMAQTANAIGVSTGWACRLRTQFIREGGIRRDKPTRGGRRRENMSIEEESAFLAPFFDQAASGGILVVGEIRRALELRLGRKVALASVYNLLHRHGWRKLAPDKKHYETDEETQNEWKKNSLKSSPKSGKNGQVKGRSE